MKKQQRKRWSDKTALEKWCSFLHLGSIAAAVIALIGQYAGAWGDQALLILFLLGMAQLLNGILYWKSNRDQAAVSLLTAAFALAAVALIVLLY